MQLTSRQRARVLTKSLIANDPHRKCTPLNITATSIDKIDQVTGLALALRQSGLSLTSTELIGICFFCGLMTTAVFAYLFTPIAIPFLFALGCYLPIEWLNNRISARAAQFNSEYPTVLLATASSIKVGMTPYTALERSIKLLSPKSILKKEVELLMRSLRKGASKELAVRQFATTVRLPDLDLFRAAYLLVLEHGGRFAPTLERLASVSKDRAMLMNSAKVSTATMRMTANLLLFIAPLLVLLIAVRTDDYWELFLNHPTANSLASAGILIIIFSYALLRKMSNFKP